MRIYLVEQARYNQIVGKRVGFYHLSIFHGISHYQGKQEKRPEWEWPATNNSNREPIHITRSGRFVPNIFGRSAGDLIVSQRVRDCCQGLPGIEFVPAVFETLVDVPMPALGDFSHEERLKDVGTDHELKTFPDVPRFHEEIGAYYSLLVPRLWDTDEGTPVEPNWGSYQNIPHPSYCKISRPLLERNSALRGGVFIFREDAFERLAPFFDLDYYGIAYIDLDPGPMLDPLTGGLRQRPDWIQQGRQWPIPRE